MNSELWSSLEVSNLLDQALAELFIPLDNSLARLENHLINPLIHFSWFLLQIVNGTQQEFEGDEELLAGSVAHDIGCAHEPKEAWSTTACDLPVLLEQEEG